MNAVYHPTMISNLNISLHAACRATRVPQQRSATVIGGHQTTPDRKRPGQDIIVGPKLSHRGYSGSIAMRSG
jgi:hypothetical protein